MNIRPKLNIMAAVATLLVSACTSTDVTPLSKNTILISTGAAPACGRSGARKIAFYQAAAETLRRGFDKFVILDANSRSEARIIGRSPVYGNVQTNSNVIGNSIYSNSTFQANGGTPIIARAQEAGLAVRMFKNGESGSGNAIDARQELGPDWKEKIAKRKSTCFG